MLNGMKTMYLNSLAYARVEGGVSECFRINSSVIQECIMSPCLVYVNAVTNDVKMGMWRRGESGDCLVSCLQMMWFYVAI